VDELKHGEASRAALPTAMGTRMLMTSLMSNAEALSAMLPSS